MQSVHVASLCMMFFNRLEIWMIHGITWRDSFSMVVPQHLTKQIKRFLRYQLIVLRVDELLPWFARLLSNDIIVMAVQGNIVFLHVCKEFISTKYFCNLYKLIVVIFALEEGFFLEDHSCKHTSKRPDVERVVIDLKVN